jgi:hypothetical protein
MRVRGLVSAAVVVSFVASARAGNVEVVPAEPASECHMRLSGNIERGDLRSIKAAKAKTGANPSTLCLDSRSGAYSEALKIVRHMLTDFPTIATRIEPDARCHGPCALIFLAGRGRGSDGQWPSRTLDARGELVLRLPSPSAEISDWPRSRRALAQAYEKGRTDFAELIGLFDKLGGTRFNPIKQRWAKPSLFYKLVQLGPARTLAIDTVGKAGNWGIEVTGVSWPATITDDMYQTACVNHYAWNLDDYEGRVEFVMKARSDYGEGLSSWEIIQGGTGGPTCSIRRPRANEPDTMLDGRVTADDPGVVGVGFKFSVQPWQLFPHGTQLKSLPGPSARH